MASTFSSDHKCYPNAAYFTPQDQVTHSNVNPMHCGLTMWLNQESFFFPVSKNYGCFDDLFLSDFTNDTMDCSSYSSSLMEVPAFEALAFDHYCNQSNWHTESPGSTYDELESNVYSSLQGYVPCANSYVSTCPECGGNQGHTTQVKVSEYSSTNVGRYSVEERKDRILRYLKKRNQRNFCKTVKYASRKTLADRRVRIRGRFAKNQEDESLLNYHNNPIPEFNNDALT